MDFSPYKERVNRNDDQSTTGKRVQYLLGTFGISNVSAFRALLEDVDGVVVAPSLCWALFPEHTACRKHQTLYIWVQNELRLLQRLVAFFIDAPGYHWPVEDTAWKGVLGEDATPSVDRRNTTNRSQLHIPLLPRCDVERYATRVFSCTHPTRTNHVVNFLLCREFVDPAALAGQFLLSRVQCYYNSNGLHVPPDFDRSSPLRLRYAGSATFDEWLACARTVEQLRDRSIPALDWARNLYFSVQHAPPTSLDAAKQWVKVWNSLHLFYVPQLRITRCPDNAHIYLVVLTTCDWSANSQHSRMYICWDRAMDSLQRLCTSSETDHAAGVSLYTPGGSARKWHCIPLMELEDEAHPLAFLSRKTCAHPAVCRSELPERCFSVIEQEEYALDEFLNTHLQSVVFFVGDVATGYPVSLSQDIAYQFYRTSHLEPTIPEPFESVTRLCLHGTFYVHTGQLCMALSQSRYLRLVPTSTEWPDAVRLAGDVSDNEQRITVSNSMSLAPVWVTHPPEVSQ